MPLPTFDTSEYEDFENPAPLPVGVKVGALSAQEATNPYAIAQKTALETNAARWKARTDALKASRLDTPDKTDRIMQALLAFGSPTRGNNWAALSNATKALSMSGKEIEDTERGQANRLNELRAQQEDAAAAIKEKYGFAGLEAKQAMALKKADAENKPMTKDRMYGELSDLVASGATLTPGQQKVWESLNQQSPSDIWAGIQTKIAQGIPLTAGEQTIATQKQPAWMHRAPTKTKASAISPAVKAAADAGIKITG